MSIAPLENDHPARQFEREHEFRIQSPEAIRAEMREHLQEHEPRGRIGQLLHRLIERALDRHEAIEEVAARVAPTPSAPENRFPLPTLDDIVNRGCFDLPADARIAMNEFAGKVHGGVVNDIDPVGNRANGGVAQTRETGIV